MTPLVCVLGPMDSFPRRASAARPLAIARHRTRDLPNQCFENIGTLLRMAGLRQHFLVLRGIYELYLAVLADPNTCLRRLDLAATDALPRFSHSRSSPPHPSSTGREKN
jgi:hypothetical protein